MTPFGVFILFKRNGARKYPKIDIRRPSTIEIAIEVWTEVLISFCLSLPMDWATIMPHPTAIPWLKDINKLIKAVLDPTAASALPPT